MRFLVCNFSIGIFLLLLLFFYILVEKGTPGKHYHSRTEALSEVTRLPGISLAFPYLENRIMYYDDFSNCIYLDIPSYRYRDFVYAQ